MGRRRWWRGGLELLVLFFLQRVVLGDGQVGCLFSVNVCRSGSETCYDDAAFGRCISACREELQEEDRYKYDLKSSGLELLRRKLERLFDDGYDWTHPYTQCVIKSSLFGLRYRPLARDEFELCQRLSTIDRENNNRYDQEELAAVNFNPIGEDESGYYAKEKYNPPRADDDLFFNERIQDDRSSWGKDEDPLNVQANINDFADELYAGPQQQRTGILGLEEKERPIFFRSRRQPSWDDDSLIYLKSRMIDVPRYLKDLPSKDDEDDPGEDTDEDEDEETILNDDRTAKNVLRPFDQNVWDYMKILNETAKLRQEENLRDGYVLFGNDDDPQDEEEIEEGISQVEESLERMNERRRQEGRLFTEGGFIEPIEIGRVIGSNDDDGSSNGLPWARSLGAFQRPERVDVKKPGPLYSTNNYAFKSPPAPIKSDEEAESDENEQEIENSEENIQVVRPAQMKKGKNNVQYNGQIFDNVDLDYLYIQFNKQFETWEEGKKVVENVAKLLNLSPERFSDIRVGRAEVTFRVNGDPGGENDAIALSRKIDGIRKELEKETKMEVIRAGIGDKVKLPPTFDVAKVEMAEGRPMSPGLFGAVVAAGGAAAAAAAVVILLIARKHAKSRAKLAGLANPDPEASKDYQELCRARMHAKQPSEKPESPRIIGLSRESESNRSSTSSWGEEAVAALTNMDIATGHMVLTYMEDHLKNKDRLDQEWAGICAYEADPSSVAIATDRCNAEKNRPGSALPYDHSRIVLNDLSNADNSDYINASTITDHDPRNPAYIATQGPTPRTSADFWQLVWEQGSVVIVMLTRLTEEGRGICHRYWPDEGSELYHIYEVHLVSEHIWCDDYLVRSFYLKNLRTGETRTVTQFHFLSWPENSVPQSTKALLEFRRKVNKSYRGRSCPIVVHCSDGAGRTGTYCLIDMVLNRMAKGAKEIDIAAALEHIRDQRPGMVATKQQFEFVLVAVAEEVHAILKALPIVPHDKSQMANVIVTPASATQSSSSSTPPPAPASDQ